jgi:TorA maturation chaperone TorD
MLATLHDREPDACLLQAMRETDFPRGLGLQLVDELGRQAVDLMRHVVASLPATLDDAILDELAADYASIYLNHTIQASPLESVWIDEERLTCQDSMFQVRSWYQQYGLGVENWRIRPDDHLVWQLQFLGHLFKLDPTTDGLRKAARFMDEHLLRWLMAFAQRVSARCATAYFAAAAMLTAAYCEELRELLVELLGETRPSEAEIEERMHPRRQVEAVPVSFMPGVGPAV